MANVDLTKVPPYYHKYIAKVRDEELKDALQTHQFELVKELVKIPEDRWNYRYAEDKWTIKEVVQHIIDAERVFTYRALRFARKDGTNLPGFDENKFAENSDAGRRTKNDLLEELAVVQRSSALLFASFSDEQLQLSGTANNNAVSVKGIGFIIAGHAIHHKDILLERYVQEKTLLN